MLDFDATHDGAAADGERRRAGGDIAIRFVDDAAEDWQHLVIDPPSARNLDLDSAPEGQHVDDCFFGDLRAAEVDFTPAHHRYRVAADEIARGHAAANPAHDR